MNEQCHQIEPLLGSYALGALDVEDRLLVETHLETCPDCQAALADYQSVADGLAFALPSIEPSPGLRARLIAETAQAPVKPRLGMQRRGSLRVMQIAVTAIVLVLVILNVNLLRNTNDILRTQETLVTQNQAYQVAFVLMTYPETQVTVLDGESIYGTLIYDPSRPIAVMNVRGLEQLEKGQTYQVWLIQSDETRISGGLFNAGDEGGYTSFVIRSPEAFETFIGVGVTIEPEGGSPGPTGPRVLGVDF